MGGVNGHEKEQREGFFFLGNQLALDFLNTRPIKNGEPAELLVDFAALLLWFRSAGLLTAAQAASLQQQWGNSTIARKLVNSMQELREKLREEVLAWEHTGKVHPSVIEELNTLMLKHPMLARLIAGKKAPAMELYFDPKRPEDLFAPLAHNAAMLFTQVDRRRVRKCDQCVLHFQDISKKGTRRWCSMQFCGNRMKVAAYAARRRRQHP